MYEQFTDRARAAVTGAQAHARRLGHAYVGTEHLLLGLSEGDGVAARALAAVGFDRAQFEQAVLDEVGQGHLAGSGHIPFTPRIKKGLAASLGHSLSMSHSHIGTEHILLGLLEDDSSLATKLAAEQGISATNVKAAVIDLLARTPTTSEPVNVTSAVDDERTGPAEPLQTRPPATGLPRCPDCREPLAPNLGAEVMCSIGEVERQFTVAYCRACGHVLAVAPER